MAVPKKKTSKGVTKTRHKAYVQKQVAKLQKLSLVNCKHCSAVIRNHHVCSECGKYNGKQILDPASKSDITTIKA